MTISNKSVIHTLTYLYNQSSDFETIRTLIDNHFKPSTYEKDTFAEVTTPWELVKEMLQTIPSNFWTRPRFVFEPCCGKGNFVIGIFHFFFKGLEKRIPNVHERCKIIIEQCIYYSDISKENVYITTELLKFEICRICGWSYKDVRFEHGYFHFHIGDTLNIDIVDKWGINGFDAIIGNPPYNKSKESLSNKDNVGILWDIFVKKALEEWLLPNGYLLFIHPPSWRKPEHELWYWMREKQILYLYMLSERDFISLFGCGRGGLDYYVLQNRPIHTFTNVFAQDGFKYQLHLNQWPFLPNGCFQDIYSILGHNDRIIRPSIYHSNTLTTQKTNYPIVHSITMEGLRILYAFQDKGHFHVPKVILTASRKQYPWNDWNGTYGMSTECYGLFIYNKKEGEDIVRAISSERFQNIIQYTKWSSFRTDWRMFTYFKDFFWKEFL